MKTRVIRIVVLVTILLLLVSSTVLAIDPPDSIQINAVYAYQYCLEDNDQLYLIDFTIEDATANITPVSQAYLVRLLSGTTELKSVAPYTGIYFPPDDGYNRQITAVYFTAAEAPAWSGNYTIELSGNPTLAWVGDIPQITSGIDYWSTASSTTLTQIELSTRILNIANLLSAAWGVELTTETASGTRLSSNGQSYFAGAIAGIQEMAPYAFAGAMIQPEWTTENRTRDYADILSANVTGTPLDLTPLATIFGVSRDVFSSIIFTIALVVFLGFVASGTGSTKLLVLVSTPAVAGVAYLGFIPLIVAIFLGLIALVVTGYVVFYSKSTA